MSSSEEIGNVNLQQWQKTIATSKPKPVRPSPARVEKGTVKVHPHIEQEKASRIMYALAHVLTNEDANIRKQFFEQTSKDIDEVVSNFGLAQDRMEREGKKLATDFVTKASRAQRLDLVATRGRKLMELVSDLKNGNDGDYGSGADLGGDGNSTDMRMTRFGGGGQKRKYDEAQALVEEISEGLKKVKSIDDTDRRRS